MPFTVTAKSTSSLHTASFESPAEALAKATDLMIKGLSKIRIADESGRSYNPAELAEFLEQLEDREDCDRVKGRK
jgi:hypothetical protein